jgi:alkanesulfonate monooxygenase SsuD/methylene tetrahydromethanopterin reductase-like flavin-dependent oxidoreductase (luciferase family)
VKHGGDAESLGVDSIWTWDHFFPLYGDSDAAHFEGWTAPRGDGRRDRAARLGMLVTCNGYRNPNCSPTWRAPIDHVSGGRMYLGHRSGWFERDYDEYGYEFGTAINRLHKLRDDLPRLKARLDRLNPAAGRAAADHGRWLR